MSGNTLGNLFAVTNFGESHGPAIGCVIDGCPPGMVLSEADIQPELDRRRPGTSKFVTQRNEPDQVEILSGVYEGRTTGTPICLLIRNTDQRSKDYSEIARTFRPGHADYTYWRKYGLRDPRGGGRSSARLTAPTVAAGAVARKWLREKFGTTFRGCMTHVGELAIGFESWDHVPDNPFFAPVADVSAIETFMGELRKSGDSCGARLRVVAERTGTTVKEALKSYVELEQSFARDPSGTLPRLLQKVGMNPMQAVLAVLKSAGATPQQFAEHVRLNPGQYQGQAMQPMRQPAQPAPDPMASRAYEEVQELKHHLVRQEVLTNVVDPFRAEHPRFDELQEDIAFFLNSGKIPDSMDDFERLAHAYDYAVRINPASNQGEPQAEPAQPTALVNPVAGKKSIRGAPTGGKAPAMRTPSIRDALANNWPV